MVHDSSCGRSEGLKVAGVVYPGVDAVIATRAFPRGSRYACPLCPTMPLRGVMTASVGARSSYDARWLVAAPIPVS